MDKQEMEIRYNTVTAAHVYALGFVYRHELYAARMGWEEIRRYFKLDRASSKRGGFAKIRIKLNKQDRAELAKTAELIGAESLLTADPAHNKGENFERELTERWTAETWVKDSVPFWVAGDIRVDGVEIQVKLDGAELTNERTLARVG